MIMKKKGVIIVAIITTILLVSAGIFFSVRYLQEYRFCSPKNRTLAAGRPHDH